MEDTVSTMAEASTPNAGMMATAAMVSPGFIRTLGMSVVRGRNFEDGDDEHHPRVAIVSRSLAERLFPSGNAHRRAYSVRLHARISGS